MHRRRYVRRWHAARRLAGDAGAERCRHFWKVLLVPQARRAGTVSAQMLTHRSQRPQRTRARRRYLAERATADLLVTHRLC